jgi:hypothetical protein
MPYDVFLRAEASVINGPDLILDTFRVYIVQFERPV